MKKSLDYLKVARARKLGIPIHAHIEITTKCNFRCVHCQIPPAISKKEMTYYEICSVLDQLADIGSLDLTISGGEPLLRADFWKIIAQARKRGFAVRLNSNGSLIAEDAAERLADLFLSEVCMSIYGMNERIYKSITGLSGVFAKVLRAVELLAKKKVRVILKTPILRENFSCLAEFRNFARSIGVQHEFFWAIHPRFDSCQTPFKHRLSASQLEEFFRSYPEYCKPELRYIPPPHEMMCAAGLDFIAVSSYGEVMPCSLIRNRTTVREKPILEIFKKDPLFIRIRKILWQDIPECSSCEAVLHCNPCPACLALETGSFTTPAPKTMCTIARIRKKVHERMRP